MNIQRSRAGTKSNMFKDKQLSNPQSQLTEVCLLSDGDSWASPICRGSPSSLNDITVTSSKQGTVYTDIFVRTELPMHNQYFQSVAGTYKVKIKITHHTLR